MKDQFKQEHIVIKQLLERYPTRKISAGLHLLKYVACLCTGLNFFKTS